MRLSSSRCARFERPLEGAGDERGDLAGDLAGDFFGGDLAGDLAARFGFAAGEVDLAGEAFGEAAFAALAGAAPPAMV